MTRWRSSGCFLAQKSLKVLIVDDDPKVVELVAVRIAVRQLQSCAPMAAARPLRWRRDLRTSSLTS
jgi:hypothetical protein